MNTSAASITGPGVYDIPEADYHSDPCPVPSLSRSIAHTLLTRSPKHAWMEHPRLNPNHEAQDKKAFDIGKAAHALVLGKPLTGIVVVDAPNWRKKVDQATRDDAYAAGQIPILRHQADEVEAMAKACRAQLDRHPEAREAFTAGRPEQTLVWREGDIWCRVMLDELPAGGNVFYDYKTTGGSAHPDDWFRGACDYGYDLQDGFYSRGITAVLKIENPVFRFVVQETAAPYALTVCEFNPMSREMAAQKAAVAIDFWTWCTRRKAWPGYPGRIAYGSAPVWEQQRWADRMQREVIAIEAGDDLKQQMIDWQSPIAAE